MDIKDIDLEIQRLKNLRRDILAKTESENLSIFFDKIKELGFEPALNSYPDNHFTKPIDSRYEFWCAYSDGEYAWGVNDKTPNVFEENVFESDNFETVDAMIEDFLENEPKFKIHTIAIQYKEETLCFEDNYVADVESVFSKMFLKDCEIKIDGEKFEL